MFPASLRLFIECQQRALVLFELSQAVSSVLVVDDREVVELALLYPQHLVEVNLEVVLVKRFYFSSFERAGLVFYLGGLRFYEESLFVTFFLDRLRSDGDFNHVRVFILDLLDSALRKRIVFFVFSFILE